MLRKMMIPVILGVFLSLGVGSNAYAAIEVTGTVAGGPVDVFANFTPTANTLTVQVWNATSNPNAVSQNISDLFFVLSTGQTTGTLTSSSGLERTVASNGTFTDGSVVSTGWDLNSSYVLGSETGLRLFLLGQPAAPAHTIIGLPNALVNPLVYSNANASIAGNGPHNPFLFGTQAAPVTFSLNIPGVTASTTISDVAFSFGTTEGTFLRQQVPEPTTLLLLGLSLVGVAGIRRRLKK